jgi:redox-sensitive bicupin YhaK (pirin superfamily)
LYKAFAVKLRSIKTKVAAQRVNMGGIFLDQAIPLMGIDQIDPFLLIHHWSDQLDGNKHQSEVGVGPHPHRGFAPVTFIFKGSVHHRDSLGNSEVVMHGGTQWMHSGKGIVHSERPSKELAASGGDFEIIQFWVNVPSEHKMAEPYYVPLSDANTPEERSKDGKVGIKVVSGKILTTAGNIDTQSPLITARLTAETGGKMEIPLPENHNALIYQLDGELTVNGMTSGAKDLIWFENDGEGIKIEASADSRAIILAGEPINEPVATYGPFVMNTDQEIREAMRDYQTGKMGDLQENFE